MKIKLKNSLMGLILIATTACGVKTQDESGFVGEGVSTKIKVETAAKNELRPVKDALEKLSLFVDVVFSQSMRIAGNDEVISGAIKLIKEEKRWMVNSVLEASTGRLTIQGSQFFLEKKLTNFDGSDLADARSLEMSGTYQDGRVVEFKLTLVKNTKRYEVYTYASGFGGAVDVEAVIAYLLDGKENLLEGELANLKVFIDPASSEIRFELKNPNLPASFTVDNKVILKITRLDIRTKVGERLKLTRMRIRLSVESTNPTNANQVVLDESGLFASFNF